MADKEKEAYWKGYNDYKRSGGQANTNPLTELFHPSYNPPSEHREAYKAGWERAKQEKDGGGGGCFLTTACVEYAGLSDDCEELQVMRKFRDEYICSLPDGGSLVEEYYQAAPLVVQRIKSGGDADATLESLLKTLRNVVELIQSGHNSEALLVCKKEFQMLKRKYGV